MSSRLGLAALVLVPGCYLVDYPTIEDACPKHVAGERFLEDGISDLLLRIDCHRRFVGLAPMPVTRPIQDAVASHATYLDQNQILEPGSPNYARSFQDVFIENASMSFFSGADAFDRLYATQAIDPAASYQVWEVISPVLDGSADREFDDWSYRDVMFQPLVLGAGYAEFETSVGPVYYLNVVYALPADRRINIPIVYPKDGQVDVPTSFVPSGLQQDPLSVRSVIGYPITITVGSYESHGGANPYDLRIISASLTGPDGEDVDLASAMPGAYPWGPDESTLAFAATTPLRPGSTYSFEAEISWNVIPHKKVRTTFTTADTGAPATVASFARTLRHGAAKPRAGSALP